jgi:hypothetical protein
MKTTSNYKPVGGVESVALYPADAVETALFSSDGCEVDLSASPIEVMLLDDRSCYEEHTRCDKGTTSVSHHLRLVADRGVAQAWLDNDFVEQASYDGFIAVVSLCDGRRLLVGYSARLGNEQPLRLESLLSTSGNSPNDTPSVTLQLVSHDADFSAVIL